MLRVRLTKCTTRFTRIIRQAVLRSLLRGAEGSSWWFPSVNAGPRLRGLFIFPRCRAIVRVCLLQVDVDAVAEGVVSDVSRAMSSIAESATRAPKDATADGELAAGRCKA